MNLMRYKLLAVIFVLTGFAITTLVFSDVLHPWFVILAILVLGLAELIWKKSSKDTKKPNEKSTSRINDVFLSEGRRESRSDFDGCD